MRVLLLTTGTTGDVLPFVAVGARLRDAGYEVSLATHRAFRPICSSAGVAYVPLPIDPGRIMASDATTKLLARPSSVAALVSFFENEIRSSFRELVVPISSAVSEADVVVCNPASGLAWHIAQERGIPALVISVQPYEQSRLYPSILLNRENDLGPLVNLLTHKVAFGYLNARLRSSVALALGKRSGSGGVGRSPRFCNLFDEARRKGSILYAFSRSLAPEFGERAIGFIEPPLSAFVPAPEMPTSTSPVGFVGFGSMRPPRPDRFWHAVGLGVSTAGLRALFQTPALSEVPAPWKEVTVPEGVDHRALFRLCDVVIHHGGGGTLSTALLAERPSVMLPFLFDQFFWARRMAQLGLAPSPIPQARVTGENLSAAIQKARRKRIMKRIAAVAHTMRSEQPLDRILERVGELVGRGPDGR